MVAPEQVKSGIRAQSIFNDLFGGIGVSPTEWKTGPLAILFFGGPIWMLAAPMPYLPQDGVWITIGALTKTIPVALAICAAAQRSARIFWILALAALASIALYPGHGTESQWSIRNGIWDVLMLTGPELPVALAVCATVKGAARFFWIFLIVSMVACSALIGSLAVSSTLAAGSARWLSFESWLIATAAGLVLLKVSRRPRQADSHVPGLPESGDACRPEQGQGAALRQRAMEFLRFVAAWACLAIFFVLMVPKKDGPRDGFSLFVGISSLPAAAWCLSLRNARASAAGVLVLILLFGLWIISVSPYGFLITSHP